MARKTGETPAGKARDGKPKKKAAKPRAARNTKARRKGKTGGSIADRANRAAKRAKANDAKGRHLGAAKQMLRDTAIVARSAQGIQQKAIAAEFDVSERTVRDVLAEQRKLRSPLEKSPMELVEEFARLYQMDAADFAVIAAAYVDTEPTVAIRAKRAGIEARRALAELMVSIGKLPTELELFRSEMEMRRIGTRMREVAEAMLNGEMSPEEAWKVYDDIARGPHETVDGTVVEELPPG